MVLLSKIYDTIWIKVGCTCVHILCLPYGRPLSYNYGYQRWVKITLHFLQCTRGTLSTISRLPGVKRQVISCETFSLKTCWKPFPYTVDIGCKSRAMNSAICVVIVFAHAGGQVFMNALRVACLCGAQVSPGTAFLYVRNWILGFEMVEQVASSSTIHQTSSPLHTTCRSPS